MQLDKTAHDYCSKLDIEKLKRMGENSMLSTIL